MALEFMKRLFSAKPRKVSRTEWENIINHMAAQFRECRVEWFSLCVRLLKDEPSLCANPCLTGQAEIETCAFQFMDAMEAIAAKRYIEPADGRSFANQLCAAITEGQNVLLKIQLQKLFLSLRHSGEDGDIFLLCDDVTKAIVMENVDISAMKIANTIPIFTNLNQSIVAGSFGDSAAVQELKRKRESR